LEKTEAGEKPFEREYWDNKISELALRGQRIIGAAYKIVDKSVKTIDHSDIQSGIVFLGLAGIIDPPREEAILAISKCKEAGITVKMITGDHADTARTIAKELGIGDGSKALLGKDLEQMTDEEMETAVMECDVFARTSPEHKLRLVKALQSRGIICAMTGDGVNDAPALRKADIGIAMGIKGTEVTKDAAEIVLVDDNFSTIVAAVEEGRRVYDNLKTTILFVLPTNGAESFLIIASILFGTMLPLTPVQILWVNMVTSVTVSLALAFERLEPGTMKRPPRSPKTPLLSGYFIWRILFVSVLIGGCTLWLNIFLLNKGFNEEFVRTITLQVIVIAQMFHLFNSRSIRRSAFRENIFSNKAVLVVCLLLFALQGAITYLPFMNMAFGTVPLGLADWKYPFMLGIAVFFIVEAEKAVMRKIDKVKGRCIV
jgi:magnesium-transporting ATPase (P-type)